MTIDSSDKDAYTQATQDAERAADLRSKIAQYGAAAVRHNVDKDWVNGWLTALGAKTVSGDGNTYRMSVQVAGDYGRTIKAASRADALAIWERHIARVKGDGKITPQNCDDRIYHVVFGDEVTFVSGPEDPSGEVPELTVAELETKIQAMLRQGVSEQGWGYRWANAALAHMSLPELPGRTYRQVQVPVAVVVPMSIAAFDGDSDELVAELAARRLANTTMISGKPTEIGTPEVEAASAAGAIDDDNDDNDDHDF